MGLQRIQPNLVIADVFARWPETVDVFIGHRMACIGCSMAAFMTLEDAIRIYDLDSESFLAELEEVIRIKEALEKLSNVSDSDFNHGFTKQNVSGREE